MKPSLTTFCSCLFAGLLCAPLSGCQLVWMASLQAERASKSSKVLPNTAVALDACQVGQSCDRSLTVHLDNWAVDPHVAWAHKGEIPPGLLLSVQPVANQPDDYLIQIEGTPTTAGDYRFQAGMDCCMTMSGPMHQAHTEPITLSITE